VSAPASVRVPIGTEPMSKEAFVFARDHYNIYPWIRDGDRLLRVLDLGGFAVVAAIDPPDASGRLAASLEADRPLDRAEVELTGRTLAFCLAADEPDPLPGLAAGDPVLAAALRVNAGIRPKRYPDLFEAVCGAICAQNVDFRRLYSMMRNLAVTFGRPVARDAGVEHAFPTADRVAAAELEELKACKVGYRAKGIRAAAVWMAARGSELSRDELRKLPLDEAVERLLPIPSIGPYSAAIVLAVGAGRGDVFHLDSFTRTIMREFYFEGREVGDDELRALALDRWGPHAGSVAHLLTTNTERWAGLLGRPDFRRSGARGG
jgi:N-glycosylase/DNA lyase